MLSPLEAVRRAMFAKVIADSIAETLGFQHRGIVAVTRIDGRRLTRSGAMGIDSETDMQRPDLQIMLKFGLFQAIRTGGLTARDGTIRGFRLSPAAADVRYSSAHEQAAHDGIDKLFHRRQII